MKEQPRTQVTLFRNSNFKCKTERLQIPQKLVYEAAAAKRFYLHKIAAVNLSKIYFLKRKHVNQTTEI